MTLLCSACIIYHNQFETKSGLCCACCGGCFPAGSAGDFILCNATKYGGCNNFCEEEEKKTTDIAREGGPETDRAEKSVTVRFFEDTFPFNLIVKPKLVRGIFILLSLALLGPAIYGASGLTPQTSAENFLPNTHPFQRFITISNAFPSSYEDETVNIQIVWGIETDDPIVSTTNRLFNPDQDDWGTPNYVTTWGLDAPAQLAILSACEILQASDKVLRTYDTESGNTTVEVQCWMQAFKRYREDHSLSFPVPGTAADTSAAVLAWAEDSLIEGPTSAYAYEDDLGWVADGASFKLAWMKIRAACLIRERAYLPAIELREHYDVWVALLAQINAVQAGSLGDAMQIAGAEGNSRRNKWLHMILQETYVEMAITGVGIGLGIAALVLFAATANVIVALLCILTIAACLCCVLGTIVAMGWQLGEAESLSMMILTGFAVDYVVHLAHSYITSNSPTRLERAHDALRDMGISVFWGMLTSFIAAVVLASLQLQFFSKFGIFFLLTIVYAYLWSVLFLIPVLATIGPEGGGAPITATKGGGDIETTVSTE